MEHHASVENPEPVAMEIRRLTEAVMRLTSELEGQRSVMGESREKKIDECTGVLAEVKTTLKVLTSKLGNGSKIDVVDDVKGTQNEIETAKSPEFSSLKLAEDDGMVVPRLVLVSDVEDVVGQQQQESQESSQVGPENSVLDNEHSCSPGHSPPSAVVLAVDEYLEKGARLNILKPKKPPRKKSVRRCPRQPHPSRLIRCDYCPRLFLHRHSIVLHVRKCKAVYEETIAFRRYCAYLEERFSETYVGHVRVTNTEKRQSGVVNRDPKKVRCWFCDREFPFRHQLISHERCHTGDRPYCCYICDREFGHSTNMVKHIKSRHPRANAYTCHRCGDNFKTYDEVRYHHQNVCDGDPPSFLTVLELKEKREKMVDMG